LSTSVCIAPTNALWYSEGGGHLWVYLNWALGFRALGCDVFWLEGVDPDVPLEVFEEAITNLKTRLEPYGLATRVALFSRNGTTLPRAFTDGCLDLEAATQADLLFNQYYSMESDVVQRFRRSALLDIDPGLLQNWISEGQISVARHDMYFTIGETVGRPGALFPDAGLHWTYSPPCVVLDLWPPLKANQTGSFTTVTHWQTTKRNSKRVSFMPFLNLPLLAAQRLELALFPIEDGEVMELEQNGWQIVDAHAVASTPWDYQRYIQNSLGEFSCAKPFYIDLQTAWISDRTICYLASGKPAVVQYTGPSRFLPDAAGLFRFRDIVEAARSLETAVADYERQSRLARSLVEEYFDAKKVVKRILELALS
jgi:hypothetical protein